MKRGLAVTTLGIALLLGAAQPSSAIEVGPRGESGYWYAIDPAGADNNVVMTQTAPNQVRVTDTAGVTLSTDAPMGTGCVSESPQSALCNLRVPQPGPALFDLAVGDDSLLVVSFPFDAFAYGGRGNDRITGPLDGIAGMVGNDVLTGGAGSSDIDGGDGRDVCVGGPGNDSCNGGRGRDRCNGGPGGRDAFRNCERHRGFERDRN